MNELILGAFVVYALGTLWFINYSLKRFNKIEDEAWESLDEMYKFIEKYEK